MKNKDEFAAGKGLCKKFEGGEERRREGGGADGRTNPPLFGAGLARR